MEYSEGSASNCKSHGCVLPLQSCMADTHGRNVFYEQVGDSLYEDFSVVQRKSLFCEILIALLI